MVTTAFSDEIVNASNFRDKQSHWLSIASKRPVTVASGDMKVTILNRDMVRNLFLQKYFLELAVQLCGEMASKKDIKTLPWISYLDKEEQKEFRNELLDCVIEAIASNKWNDVEILIEDWKATAETESNKEAMAALRHKVSKDKYIPLKPK
jgi:hypothetical protein